MGSFQSPNLHLPANAWSVGSRHAAGCRSKTHLAMIFPLEAEISAKPTEGV